MGFSERKCISELNKLLSTPTQHELSLRKITNELNLHTWNIKTKKCTCCGINFDKVSDKEKVTFELDMHTFTAFTGCKRKRLGE